MHYSCFLGFPNFAISSVESVLTNINPVFLFIIITKERFCFLFQVFVTAPNVVPPIGDTEGDDDSGSGKF